DCGLFQERKYQKYNCCFPFDCDNIDFVLITHNHTDHIGRLPLLDKKGFCGKVYVSKQTEPLLPLALYDSYKVLRDTAKRNHSQPLYAEENVASILKKVVGCKYEETLYVHKNIKVTYFINGH